MSEYTYKLKPVKSKFLRYARSYLPLWQKNKIGLYGVFGHGDLGDDGVFFATKDLIGKDILPLSKRTYIFNPRVLSSLLIGGGTILNSDSLY